MKPKKPEESVLAYYTTQIVSQLQKEKTVLISAHGNSLRALVMEPEQMTSQEIVQLEIPTGEIIVYDFNNKMKMIEKSILIR
ncbi:MAG TPA: hypothetical protein EYG74_06350 [Sulfurimonas autotrophica]|nr:hypothetical protein [Sulfurimonas autotrophica]